MTEHIQKIKTSFRDRQFLFSLGVAFIFLFISLVINFYAGTYANARASSAVTDIILSNIRVFDVDGIFTYGPIIFFFFLIIIFFFHPNRIPFSLKSVALFVVVRSIFITLTHIGPFPTISIVEPGSLMSKFTFGGDLFFSGHTGLPFLMSLIFWEKKILRYLFLATSILFGVIVLMGHLHYSIDVLGAFFITYTIFCMSEFFFKKDQQIFLSE